MDAKQAMRLAALTTTIAMLAACGGGGSSSPAPSPSPSPSPSPAPAIDRIEPYDTSAAKAAQADTAPAAKALAPSAAQVQLGALQGGSLAKAAAVGGAQQIGVARAVPDLATTAATAKRLAWTKAGNGTQVAAISVTSGGARGLRLGVLVRALPEGAVLRFYAQGGADVIEASADQVNAAIARNLQAGEDDLEAHTYWSPDFGGANTTLEVQIPASAAPGSVQIAIPRVSHYLVSPSEASAGITKATGVGASGSCEVDVNCTAGYQDQSRSVARMTFVKSGGTFLCTGTLLNDRASDGKPYFLSANHCISTQASASSLQTDWFYRSSACGSSSISTAYTRRTGGAQLLYATASTDTSFMLLNDAPPAGVVYAGSYFGTPVATGTQVADVHQPEGDLQKLSLGIVQGYSICTTTAGCLGSDAGSGTFLSVGWQQGATELGSSGSGAYTTIGSTRYVVGQLYGGLSKCSNPAALDYFGRFDTAYNAALKQWLNP
ncbi:MAG: endoproteinase ArgC [Acidovorax sp.]